MSVVVAVWKRRLSTLITIPLVVVTLSFLVAAGSLLSAVTCLNAAWFEEEGEGFPYAVFTLVIPSIVIGRGRGGVTCFCEVVVMGVGGGVGLVPLAFDPWKLQTLLF